MKKHIIFVMLLVAVSFTLQMCGGGSDTQKALRRVETVLNGFTSLDEGRSFKGNEFASLCMWWNGTLRSLDGGMPDKISDAFDRWRVKGDIFPFITEFTVDDAVSEGGAVIVSGTIEGAPFKMRVIDKRPITWEQVPEFEEEE